jgi:hypothetical protein
LLRHRVVRDVEKKDDKACKLARSVVDRSDEDVDTAPARSESSDVVKRHTAGDPRHGPGKALVGETHHRSAWRRRQ